MSKRRVQGKKKRPATGSSRKGQPSRTVRVVSRKRSTGRRYGEALERDFGRGTEPPIEETASDEQNIPDPESYPKDPDEGADSFDPEEPARSV